MAKPVVAAFDFDETLITVNTLPDFIKFSVPFPVFALKSVRFTPTLLLFALKRITNDEAKQRLLTLFFGSMKTSSFTATCERYADRLDQLANNEALERVKWHHKKHDDVIIVSASAEDWIKPWAARHGITTVLATGLEKKKGKLTGRLSTPNCHGAEKVTRVLSQYPDRESYTLIAYGDGKSDRQIFALSDKHYEKKFA